MEPDIKEFFRRITISIAYLVIWLFSNSILGLKYDLAFFDNGITTANVIFYCWLILSFGLLLFLVLRVWRHPVFKDENR